MPDSPLVFSKPCKGVGCSMPLYWNQLPGTERDESKRDDYCAECTKEVTHIGEPS